MKLIAAILLASAITWTACVYAESDLSVEPGAHFDDVIALLGEPEGLMRIDTSTWMQYDRGIIKLKNDRVVEANLISAAEARIRKETELKQQMERERMLAEQRNLRITEGQAVKNARISDPYFMSLPAGRQVAYWRQFQMYYPEVPSQMEYMDALSSYEYEQELLFAQQAQERKIRELEDRVARAERLNEEYSRTRYVQARYLYAPAPVYYVTSGYRGIRGNCAPVTTTINASSYAGRYCTPGVSLAARMSF